MAESLLLNDKFSGPLNLEENALTDISALAISKVLRKRDTTNITRLNLSKNKRLSHKAGEYIGQALIDNPSCKIERINFEDVHLGETGLLRIIEASNQCHHIETKHVGTVTDSGLRILAEKLIGNQGLEVIQFEETSNHQMYWSVEAMLKFAEMLKTSTNLVKVEANFRKETKDLEVS